jgi:hypothetical protein
MKKKRVAIILLGVAFVSVVSAAKVSPEEFDQTATVREVTSRREIKKVTESGRVRYGTQFVAVTEIGDQVYDLSGPQRIKLGTYRAKIDSSHNRVQFLLQGKDGKLKSSAWYEIVGERRK